MYLFKQDTLRDGVIDAKEIEQWRQILNEYEESLKEITTTKNEEKIDLKKIQEQTAKGLLNEVINHYYNRRNNKYKSSDISM